MQETYRVAASDQYMNIIDKVLSYSAERSTLVLALQGDLGAGKTTFTQMLAKQLGVTEPVTSPTFTIMKRYPISHESFDTLIHIDAYRFESEAEATPLRLSAVLVEPRAIVCVEWPERIGSLLPKDAILMNFEIATDQTRSVTVVTPSS